MTLPLRRNRRTTRPSTRGWKATSGLAAALAALVALDLSPASAELQWRSAGVPRPAAARVRVDAAVNPASHDAPLLADASRSILIRREERVAMAPEAFDPFEGEVAMPAADTAAVPTMPEFDPFEADDAAVIDAAPGVEEAPGLAEPLGSSDVAALQDAFEAPQPDQSKELEAAREAIDRELMRREIEEGAASELVIPETDKEIVDEQAPVDEGPQLEDELVTPNSDDEPLTDQELLDESFGAGEYGDDEELLQVGPDGQPLPLTPAQIEARRRQLEQERRDHEAECAELYRAVREDSIKNISLDIRPKGHPGEDFPLECLEPSHAMQPRSWPQITYLWKASGMCHKPLYFEQVQLERYGHSWGPVLQPVMSGAHFFGSIPILPYKMGLQTPQECVYTLGYYRPGSCAPYMIQPPGFTWRAAAFQAGAVTGAAVVVP